MNLKMNAHNERFNRTITDKQTIINKIKIQSIVLKLISINLFILKK